MESILTMEEILEESLALARECVRVFDALPQRKKFTAVLFRNVMRDSASTAATVAEASRLRGKQFVSKMNVALSFARRAQYYLRLTVEINDVDRSIGQPLLKRYKEVLQSMQVIFESAQAGHG